MSEDKKVFLITSGTYSDYSVGAVFSTRELAEAYLADLKKINLNDDSLIEEWPLDSAGDASVKEYWVASIRIDNGDLVEEMMWNDGRRKSGPYYDWARPNQRVRDWPNLDMYPVKDSLGIPAVIQVSSFVSQEHANKVVIEKRQQIMARKAIGIPGIDFTEIPVNYGDTVD